MSRYDYLKSRELWIKEYPFYALIMAAMRQADTRNMKKLRALFPDAYTELQKRYNAPGGYLPKELKEAYG